MSPCVAVAGFLYFEVLHLPGHVFSDPGFRDGGFAGSSSVVAYHGECVLADGLSTSMVTCCAVRPGRRRSGVPLP